MTEISVAEPARSRTTPLGLPWLVFIFLALVVLCGGLLVFQHSWKQYQRHQYYQAVFLTNDQVYYGHLRNWSRDQVVLTDVYYAQAADMEKAKESTQPQYLLVKLREHATGPQDKLFINRDHILYVEDLRTDSQIVQLILGAKK